MMLLLLMIGIKLDMGELYWLIWFVVLSWKLGGYWKGTDE